MSRLIGLAVVALLALACPFGSTFAQDTMTKARAANSELLTAIIAQSADATERDRRVNDFLESLSPDEQFYAQYDVLELALNKEAIGHRAYGKAMIELYSRYRPNSDISLDYWRYYVMIAAKLERKEIDVEEFDYLRGRKLFEARSAMSERKRHAAAAAKNESLAAAADAQAKADAVARRQEADDRFFYENMRELSDRLKSSRGTGTNTRCTQLGGVLNCTTQ
jgi:hypothetical protein